MGSDLHHCSGQVGEEGGRAVVLAQAGVASVNMCPVVFAAENGPFGEDGKPIQGRGTGAADHGIGQDPVVEGQIDAVMIPVKSHRLDGGLLRLEIQDRRFHHFCHYYHPHRLARQTIQSCTSGRLSCTWGS